MQVQVTFIFAMEMHPLRESAKSHHQDLRYERDKDEGRVKTRSTALNPSDSEGKKEKRHF